MADSSALDIRDIMLEVTAETQQIIREIMEELAEPTQRAQAIRAWMQAPDQMKEQFARERPAEYREILDAMKARK